MDESLVKRLIKLGLRQTGATGKAAGSFPYLQLAAKIEEHGVGAGVSQLGTRLSTSAGRLVIRKPAGVHDAEDILGSLARGETLPELERSFPGLEIEDIAILIHSDLAAATRSGPDVQRGPHR